MFRKLNIKSTYSHAGEESLEYEGHGDGEDGAAGGGDAVDQAHVLAEVVAQDGQGWRVHQ